MWFCLVDIFVMTLSVYNSVLCLMSQKSELLYILMNCSFCHCKNVSVAFMNLSRNLEIYFGSSIGKLDLFYVHLHDILLLKHLF